VCDSRLQLLADRLQSGTIKVLSFDVFQTLLIRPFSLLEGGYLSLARRFKNKGLLREHISVEQFAYLRHENEIEINKRERKRFGFISVTLAQVYESLKKLFKETDSTILQKEELLHEKEHTMLNPLFLPILKQAKSLRIPIIIVSDTCYSQEDLSFLLDGLPEKPMHIFSSAEYYRKTDGVFKEVLKVLQIPASELYHVGDHFEADFLASKVQSVDCLQYAAPEYFQSIRKQEEKQFQNSELTRFSNRAYLQDIRESCLFSEKLVSKTVREQFFFQYGASIFGPIFSSYIHWIYRRVQELSISTVVFLMREGDLLYPLYESMENLNTRNIKYKQAWTSRYCVELASIIEGTVEELSSLVNTKLYRKTLKEFTDSLGIFFDAVPSLKGLEHTFLYSKSFIHWVAQEIIKYQKEEVLKASAQKRKNLIHYFKNIMEGAKGVCAFVDLGYSGTIQKSLDKIFKYEGMEFQTYFFYMMSTVSSAKLINKGSVFESFLIHMGKPTEVQNRLTAEVELLELLSQGVLGSLLSFDSQGQVEVDKNHLPLQQLHEGLQAQEGIRAFHQEVLTKGLSDKLMEEVSSNEFKASLRSILVRAVLHPTLVEVQYLREWQHEHNCGEGTTARLISKNLETSPQISYLSHKDYHELRDPDALWAGGQRALLSKEVGFFLVPSFDKGGGCVWASKYVGMSTVLALGANNELLDSCSEPLYTNPFQKFHTFLKLDTFPELVEFVIVLQMEGQYIPENIGVVCNYYTISSREKQLKEEVDLYWQKEGQQFFSKVSWCKKKTYWIQLSLYGSLRPVSYQSGESRQEVLSYKAAQAGC
jgi:predicted HAD superfamily hydrolase